MTRTNSNIASVLYGLMMLFLGVPYAALFQALTGWQLWQWFLIPINAPDISGWHIAGISILVGYFRSKVPTTEKDARTKVETIILVLIYPPITTATFLISGWIIAKLAGLA